MRDLDKVILTDCDGVLLNWEYAFDVWIKRRGYTIKEGSAYDVGIRYGIEKDLKRNFCRQFNESAHMAFVPPFRDAIKYVRKLHEEHGYVFHVITSMTNDPYAQDLRKMNLRKVFGETVFERFEFTDTGADKDEILEKYRDSGLYWIEDKLENAVLGKRMGLNSVIMEHDHNVFVSDGGGIVSNTIMGQSRYIRRMKNWRAIYGHITGEF